jgi:hypothetical protein
MAAWRQYGVQRAGRCLVNLRGCIDAEFEIGIIETGRSRVYAGIFLKITLPDGWSCIGEDRWSPIAALHDVARRIEAEGGAMMCVGLDPRFNESGLSSGTGYGYLDGQGEALYMMEPTPS